MIHKIRKPSNREFKKVLTFLNEAKRRIDQLGEFDVEFAETTIHSDIDYAIKTIRKHMKISPWYMPLTRLLGIEQGVLEVFSMWMSYDIGRR